MIRALFICTQNRLRSPTAEHVFAELPGVSTDSAGLGNDAEVRLSPEQLEWADIVFVMEAKHRKQLSSRFQPQLKDKRIITLGIPDDYDYMAPALIALLKLRVLPFLQGPDRS